MFRTCRSLAYLLLALSIACSDATTAPQVDGPTESTRSLVDASTPGSPVPGFYFLVPTLAPPPARFSGTFDAALSPVVDICALTSDNPQMPSECAGPAVVTLNSSSPPPQTVQLDAKAENYTANWNASVTAGKKYRAFVAAGGRVLGYVDLFGVKKQRDAVPAGFVAVVVNKPFLFKFRIETGIAGSIIVSPATAELKDADTPAQSQLFTASVLDLHGAPLASKAVAWTASNATLVSLSPTTATTSSSGQATSTASPIGRVGTSTAAVVTATIQGLAATAVLTVKPTAGRPIAVADAYGVIAGTSLTITAPGVLGNDVDLDSDPLTVAGVTDNVDHGTLSLQANGSFSYTPAPGYTGTDAFSYTVVDPSTLTSLPTTVTIEVLAPSNLAPVANDDHFVAFEGGTRSVKLPGFLANDADPSGETLTATLIVSSVSHGSLSAFPDGSFSYKPTTGYTGTDAFTYRLQNASGKTAQATVTIDVLEDPDKNPIAVADLYAVIEGTAFSRPAPGFLGNDSDPDGSAVTATLIVSSVSHGSLTAFPNGSFSYTPTAGYTGTDAFTYRVQDAHGKVGEATVTFQVLPNSTTNPVAVADSYVAYEGRVLQISASGFLANDIDPDGQPITATLITSNVAHGSLTGFADGSFSYSPSAGYVGADAFSYRMQDASGNTAEATVTIQVYPDPDEQPVGVADTYTTFAGKTLDVVADGFLANDIDPDGTTLTATLIASNVAHGSLTAFADGSFTYTPQAGYTGTDTFEYKMQDATGKQSDPVLVTIDVRPDPNQPPIGLPDHFAVLGGTVLSISAPGFLANDVDLEGEAIVATLITDTPDHGTVVAFADGSFTYTPNAGFVGTDAFSYRMQDASSHAGLPTTVTIEVLDPALTAPAIMASAISNTNVSGDGYTPASRVPGAGNANSLRPLPVGSTRSPEMATAAGARPLVSSPSHAGAVPLSNRATMKPVRPVPHSRIDPAVFGAGKTALPNSR